MEFHDPEKIDFVAVGSRGNPHLTQLRAKALETIPIGKAVKASDPELFGGRKSYKGVSSDIRKMQRKGLLKKSSEFMVRTDTGGDSWIVRVA